MGYLRSVLPLLAMIGAMSHSFANDTYNIRQISNRDGLSNSAVLCIIQDGDRNLWAGTFDGLNKYNGVEIDVYKPDIKDPFSISGNVIRRIAESREDYIWIITKGGLNQYSKKSDRIEGYFNEFPENSAMATDSEGNIFIMKPNGQCSWYDFADGRFREVEVPDFNPKSGWISMIIDPNDKMWITNNGVIRQYSIDRSGGGVELEWLGNLPHSSHIFYIYYDRGTVIFGDGRGDLFTVRGGEKKFIRNVRSIMADYGDITTIIVDGEDPILGFNTGGLVKLDASKGYQAVKFPINCGIFSMFKDDAQDILWVGTDGQGLYACVKDGFIFKGFNLEELPTKTQRPVRAIYRDHLGDLWLGTKGNGIIRIRDYAYAQEYTRDNVDQFTVSEGLSNEAVFKFEMSKAHNVLWIGSTGPQLNYYSYDDNRIHTLKNGENIPFVEVHSILETSDSTLWVSSMFTLLKVDIKKTASGIEARKVNTYDFDITSKHLYNKIYSLYQENDSIMWLAMRGNGAIRFNSQTGDYRLITMDRNGIAPMNDILSIHIDKNREVWLGSSYGINNLKELPDGGIRYRNYNENDGLSNNTIHGILESDSGELWFSSNSGIILFDPDKKTFRNFNHRSGLKVVEFSDNAYYKDEEESKYFFGGVDGVVWIEHGVDRSSDFVPPIRFTKLRILNEEANIDQYIVRKKGKERLVLKHDQDFFSVLFSTNDFIDGASIKFAYMLENFNAVWMNTTSREAQFTNIPAGDYVLKVKYGDLSGRQTQVASLDIRILPPWYLSLYARLFYVVAALGALYLVYLYITRKYERRREQLSRRLDQKYKEEMYENKLRFFTNITHEFCTPLTLIHTPSERILDYAGSDEYVKKYAHTIKSNSERLNNLIQEIIDFRRMETGNKVCRIESCDVNKICGEIMDAFADLAVENSIDFQLSAPGSVVWNSDPTFLSRILNNLVSNAFKYTPRGGEIKIGVEAGDDLRLTVHNTGKGIRQEDIPFLFNRYSVMDNIGENSIGGLSSRNGLGLAICKSMTALLGGEIGVESEVGRFARFTVTLPRKETPAAGAPAAPSAAPDSRGVAASPQPGNPDGGAAIQAATGRPVPDGEKPAAQDDRPRILVVDDNPEILDLLNDVLSTEYRIITAKDGVEGYAKLTERMPDLVMTDIMMPNRDGFLMTRQIKLDPHTMHIPIVIVSARTAIDDKIEGVESGADAYISKPFDTKYLRTVVRHLIEKHKRLKEYYNSAASSFDYLDGRLVQKEDRSFIEDAVSTIERNIADMDFSPEDLADHLGISLRSLYRRFKDLGLPSPKDFIKKQRIEYSAKLLSSTNLTIQEIMYSAGFTTRSHFYKEFTKRYGRSPREYREDRERQWEEERPKT